MSHIKEIERKTPSFNKSPSVIIVPETNEATDFKLFRGAVRPGLKSIIKTNLDIVNNVDIGGFNDKEKYKMVSIRELLNRAWKWYEHTLDYTWTSQDAIGDFFNFADVRGIPHLPMPKDRESQVVDIRSLEEYFKHYFLQTHGPTVIVSETHATTTPLIRVLKDANPDLKIGMFVFDTHIDTDPGPYEDTPRKSNTLRLLVDGDDKGHESVVDKLTVIGVPDRIEVDQRNRQDWGIGKYGRKIKVVTEDELIGDDPHTMSFSKKVLDKILFDEINGMKQEGITNIVFSVDLDVLKNAIFGLTAIEYSPFHALLYLASLRELSVYSQVPRMVYDLLTNTGFAGEIDGSILDYPITLGGKGLSVLYIEHGLKKIRSICKELDMEFGIKINNSKVVGDIVELSGPDFDDRTKKTVQHIVQAMFID